MLSLNIKPQKTMTNKTMTNKTMTNETKTIETQCQSLHLRRIGKIRAICGFYILSLLMLGVVACGSSSSAQADEPALPVAPEEPAGSGQTQHTPPSALPGQPVGFASLTAAPTGGEGGQSVVVTTAAELGSALKRSEPLIIYLQGEITFTNLLSVKAADKTLLGLSGSKLVSAQRDAATSGILSFKEGSTNLILRNLTFESAGAYDCDGRDNLCIDGTTRIWVDHCDFQDGVDGNFDCKNASDEITISFCRFRYLKAPLAGGSGGSADHRFCNLWGSSDSQTQDRGHLRTTFLGCWWDEGCRARMPRVRFAQVHIVECLYSSSVASRCVELGYEANVRVERSVFRNIKQVYMDHEGSDSDHQGSISFADCLFPGSTAATSLGTTFTPPYTLPSPLSVSEVEAKVRAEAGATLSVK